MNVRELRVTDIRCRECFAGPGERCFARFAPEHASRVEEHRRLVAAGWQWQEVDQRDAGADRDSRSRG